MPFVVVIKLVGGQWIGAPCIAGAVDGGAHVLHRVYVCVPPLPWCFHFDSFGLGSGVYFCLVVPLLPFAGKRRERLYCIEVRF